MDNQVKDLLDDMRNQLENGEEIPGVCNDAEIIGDFIEQLQDVVGESVYEIGDGKPRKCGVCGCVHDTDEDHECCNTDSDDVDTDDGFDPSKHFKLSMVAGTVIGEKLTVEDTVIINAYKNDLAEIYKTRDYISGLLPLLLLKSNDTSDDYIAFCETVYARQFNYLVDTLGIDVKYDKDVLTVPMLALAVCMDSLLFINNLIGDILDVTVRTSSTHSVVDGTDIFLFREKGDLPSYKYDTLTGEYTEIPSIPTKHDDNVVMEETTDEITQSVEQ